MILNLASLSPNEVVKVIKLNEGLRIDFFKFELYRMDFLSKEAVKGIFAEIPCRSTYYEDVLEFCMDQKDPEFINNFILCNSDILYENQLCLTLKVILSRNSEASLTNIDSESLALYKQFIEENNFKNNAKVFNLYLMWTLLVQKPGIFDKKLLFKSLIIEFEERGDQGKEEDQAMDGLSSAEEKGSSKKLYNIKALVDLFYIILQLNKISSERSPLFYLNTLIDVFLFLERIQFIDSSFISSINNIVKTDKSLNSKIERLKSEDSKYFNVKGIVDNYFAIKESMTFISNRQPHKHVFSEKLSLSFPSN
eukprot:CAMPEP_0170518524 /NCGR_PEP_ID=MMETSP0209-20121228/4191_1 /TAXON_ID=665100 ORGANISM="Litonotus pictus, Strain P1" /NCGR_SAMPLE_ID=MMETSP0209 /ASSEMBLY_ACC=CAM_ASM_000301 /LENGTH=308 /DNA_ID=CAMNT_0010804113 /DNA_START=134 /DNA_END=1060 /DNA_ORIENTATION=+